MIEEKDNASDRIFHLRRKDDKHSVTAIWDQKTNDFVISDTGNIETNGLTYHEYIKYTKGDVKWVSTVDSVKK